jgi:DNA-directed RNA polymerase subunit RPC12/RpoP
MANYEFYGPEEARRQQRTNNTISRFEKAIVGKCIECGRKIGKRKRRDRVRCARCLKRNSASQRKRATKAKNIAWLAGNCIECKAHPAVPGRKMCQGCIDTVKIRRDKKRANTPHTYSEERRNKIAASVAKSWELRRLKRQENSKPQ